jgi:hypothetical protein
MTREIWQKKQLEIFNQANNFWVFDQETAFRGKTGKI